MTTKFEMLQAMLEHAAASDSPHVAAMQATVEDSSWHREASVWVHTEMVVAEFLKIWEESGRDHDDWIMFRAGIAALFHDFGKPNAEEERTNKEGALYRRYAGHESISATEFRDLATGWGWAALFGEELQLEAEDLYTITVMIQHHLPYAYKDELRLEVLQACWWFNGHDLFPFFALLRADARGRISDDHEQKLANVEEWIKSATEAFGEPPQYFPNSRCAYVLIGPSGAGKSTYMHKFASDTEIYSMDALRLEHYGDDSITNPAQHYTAAWQAANEDEKEFRKLTTARINAVVKSDAQYVISDNTNLTKKARREFIAAAKQSGRIVVGVCFVTPSMDDIVTRGAKRGDRGIPVSTLVHMHRLMYLPVFDEVDVVFPV